MFIKVINGPNLNLLGMREPHIYGIETCADIESRIIHHYPDHTIEFFQSNVEGELINLIQDCENIGVEAIIINPGGYAHTSVAIADAIRAISIPCIEVHISHIHSREEYRHQLITATSCIGLISGLGSSVYDLAIEYLTHHFVK